MSPFLRIDPILRPLYFRTVDETLQTYLSRPEATARRAKGLRGSSLLPPTLDLSKIDDVTVCTLRALRRDRMFNEFTSEELVTMIEERKAA